MSRGSVTTARRPETRNRRKGTASPVTRRAAGVSGRKVSRGGKSATAETRSRSRNDRASPRTQYAHVATIRIANDVPTPCARPRDLKCLSGRELAARHPGGAQLPVTIVTAARAHCSRGMSDFTGWCRAGPSIAIGVLARTQVDHDHDYIGLLNRVEEPIVADSIPVEPAQFAFQAFDVRPEMRFASQHGIDHVHDPLVDLAECFVLAQCSLERRSLRDSIPSRQSCTVRVERRWRLP